MAENLVAESLDEAGEAVAPGEVGRDVILPSTARHPMVNIMSTDASSRRQPCVNRMSTGFL